MGLIDQHGMVAVFVLILLEYACFPLPSEVVLPFSGAVAAAKHTGFLPAFLLSVLAGAIGASICYAIGRFGGGTLLGWLGRKLPNMQEGLEASRQKHQNAMYVSVCVGRLVPICRTYISFAAGAAKQGYVSYILPTLLGISIWNLALVGIGYALGDHWNVVMNWYDRYKTIVLPVMIALFAFLIYRKVRKLFKKKAA